MIVHEEQENRATNISSLNNGPLDSKDSVLSEKADWHDLIYHAAVGCV